jgi:hypothetical protein
MTDEKPGLPVDEFLVTAMNESKAEADPDHQDETDAIDTAAFLNGDYLP